MTHYRIYLGTRTPELIWEGYGQERLRKALWQARKQYADSTKEVWYDPRY